MSKAGHAEFGCSSLWITPRHMLRASIATAKLDPPTNATTLREPITRSWKAVCFAAVSTFQLRVDSSVPFALRPRSQLIDIS